MISKKYRMPLTGNFFYFDFDKAIREMIPAEYFKTSQVCLDIKDRVGKLIYENDIVNYFIPCFEGYKINPIHNHVVKFINLCWGLSPVYPSELHPDDRNWKPFYDPEEDTIIDLNYLLIVGNTLDIPT